MHPHAGQLPVGRGVGGLSYNQAETGGGGHKRGEAQLFLHWYACMEIFYPLARICHMMISNHASQLTRLTTQLRPRMVNSV